VARLFELYDDNASRSVRQACRAGVDPAWIVEAADAMAEAGKLSAGWPYLRGILRRYRAQGGTDRATGDGPTATATAAARGGASAPRVALGDPAAYLPAHVLTPERHAELTRRRREAEERGRAAYEASLTPAERADRDRALRRIEALMAAARSGGAR
jgi:hypothetical protein